MMPVRKSLLAVHRWLALTAGLLAMVSALTGLMLTFSKPLDRLVNSHYFQSSGVVNSYEDIAVAAQQRFGPAAQIRLRFPAEPNGSVQVLVRGENWGGEAFIDSRTAKILGERELHAGWYNFVLRLHSELLLGDVGESILATGGAELLILLTCGLILWWPKRLARAFRVNLRGPTLAFLYDGHRVAGAVFGLLMLVSVATGIYVLWKPASALLNTLVGQAATNPPSLPRLPFMASTAAISLDTAVATADRLIPGGRVVDLWLPRDGNSPISVRLHLPGDPHPNGMTYIWIDPRTGTVLNHVRWDQADLGTRLQGWIYPYHSGRLWGTMHLGATALVASAFVWLGISGSLLWWRRRQRGA